MNDTPSTRAKVTKPHANFDKPRDVVEDPTLSTLQKQKALESLEQDARQLAVASAEGMAGGEPTTLHDVLDAKQVLQAAPVANAYEVVMQDLRSCRDASIDTAERSHVDAALSALDALAPTRKRRDTASSGSKAEIEEEIAKEKLDP